MENIRYNFERACNEYLEAFCAKHNYDYEPTYAWVGDDVGGVANVGDIFIDMATIRTDIDKDAPDDEFLKWYDYTMRLWAIDTSIPIPNFDNWLRGYPRKSEEEIKELERLHARVEDAKAALEEAIKSEF